MFVGKLRVKPVKHFLSRGPTNAVINVRSENDATKRVIERVTVATGPNGEAMVWKLDKAIYGTVQAARLFAIKLRAALLDIGFERSIDDPSVYRFD